MSSENNIVINHISDILSYQERPLFISKGMANLIRMPALPLKITSNCLSKNSYRTTFEQNQRKEIKLDFKSQREQISRTALQKANLKKHLSDITQIIPQQLDQNLQSLPETQGIGTKNSFIVQNSKESQSQYDDDTQNQSKFITEQGQNDPTKQMLEHKKNLSSITANPINRPFQAPITKFLPLNPQKSQILEIPYLKYPKLMLKDLYSLRNKSLKSSKFQNDIENSEFFIHSKSFGINTRPNKQQPMDIAPSNEQKKTITVVKSIILQKEQNVSPQNAPETISLKSNNVKVMKKKYRRNLEDVLKDLEIDLDWREKDPKKCYKNLLQRNILVQQTINGWYKKCQ